MSRITMGTQAKMNPYITMATIRFIEVTFSNQ